MCILSISAVLWRRNELLANGQRAGMWARLPQPAEGQSSASVQGFSRSQRPTLGAVSLFSQFPNRRGLLSLSVLAQEACSRPTVSLGAKPFLLPILFLSAHCKILFV